MISPELFSKAEALVVAASEAGFTCATAESCTGGLVSAAITSVSGSSAVLRGGIVSYDPEVKHDLLGVPNSVINDPAVGVVSDVCARQMCLGAREVLKADLAVSVTGIAGPGGAEPGKPVGTVWFGIANVHGAKTRLMTFSGDRASVREQAALYALDLLHEALMEALRKS